METSTTKKKATYRIMILDLHEGAKPKEKSFTIYTNGDDPGLVAIVAKVTKCLS